jgi:hypothetical protein
MVANPSDSVLEIEDDYKQENPSFVARLLEEVSPKKEWTFEVLTGRAVTFGIGNQSVWLSKCQTLAEEHPELDFIWSNQAKSEFSIDLTQMLLAAGGGHQNQQQSMKQPCLVVKAKFTEAIFDNKKPGQLDILVNSVFTSTDGAAHLNRLRALLDHCPPEIDRSLMELVNVVVEDFHNPLCGRYIPFLC